MADNAKQAPTHVALAVAAATAVEVPSRPQATGSPVAARYGDAVAHVYERWNNDRDLTPAADFLRRYLDDGDTFLELGSGTGAVAAAVSNGHAIATVGLDGSLQMLQNGKRGAAGHRLCADFSAIPLRDASVDVAAILYSSVTLAASQTAQATLIAEAARVLRPGGRLVVEVFVPQLDRYRGSDQSVELDDFLPNSSLVNLVDHDSLTQHLSIRRLEIGDGGIKSFPIELRYVWPSELDLMAKASRLSLIDDARGFDGASRTSTDRNRVVTYER